jgi:hypothetical protein
VRPVRIGITGHIKLVNSCVPGIEDAVRNFLTPISETQEIVGVSSLAAGADQIFANVVLELGGVLDAIIPATDYRDDIIDDDGVEQFDELLSRARTIQYAHNGPSGAAAYLAAGEKMLGAIDQLIAVWDGIDSPYLGGTSDIVARARRIGLPVNVIWPDGAERRQ